MRETREVGEPTDEQLIAWFRQNHEYLGTDKQGRPSVANQRDLKDIATYSHQTNPGKVLLPLSYGLGGQAIGGGIGASLGEAFGPPSHKLRTAILSGTAGALLGGGIGAFGAHKYRKAAYDRHKQTTESILHDPGSVHGRMAALLKQDNDLQQKHTHSGAESATGFASAGLPQSSFLQMLPLATMDKGLSVDEAGEMQQRQFKKLPVTLDPKLNNAYFSSQPKPHVVLGHGGFAGQGILAHELGHQNIDAGKYGNGMKFVQDELYGPTSQLGGFVAPFVTSKLVNDNDSVASGAAKGFGIGAAIHSPMLSTEMLASYDQLKHIHGVHKSSLTGRQRLLASAMLPQAFGTYLGSAVAPSMFQGQLHGKHNDIVRTGDTSTNGRWVNGATALGGVGGGMLVHQLLSKQDVTGPKTNLGLSVLGGGLAAAVTYNRVKNYLETARRRYKEEHKKPS